MTVGTIFSFGEHQMVMSALNAVGMIFGSPTFNGGSLILLSFLIALLFMILPAVSGGKPNVNAFLILFFLYFGGIQPKMTLTVEDYYTGQVDNVANIPLIVGVPASFASKISYELGNLIESTMTTPTASKTFKDGGFANPLKLIYSLRPGNVKSASSNWSNSFESYIRDCAQYSTAWDSKKAINTPILTNYMLATDGSFPVAGLTVFYADGGPTAGSTYTCESSQSALAAATGLVSANPIITAGGLHSLITKSFSDRPIPIVPGTELSNLTDALNDVTGGLMSAQQDAQSFIVNAIAMQPLSNAIKCNTSASLMTSTCIANAGVFSAQDQTRLDQAAGASIFAKTAVPMMNILMILFYLFSPILLIVAMMMPSKTIAVLGGYIMFAVWTQSFLPTAMVINYIIQMQTSDALGQMASGGVNMTNAYPFYEVLATKIGLASELFALTPMLSMALLSGSVYGLTKLSGAMNPRDHFDEKAMSPDPMKNGALAEKGALVGSGSEVSMNVDGHGNFVNNDTKGQIGEDKLKVGAALEKTGTHNEALSTSEGHNASKALEAKYSQTKTQADTRSLNVKYGEALSKTKTDSADKINTIVEELAHGTKLTAEDRTAMKGYIGAKLQMGTPLAEIIGTGANLAAEAGIEHGTAVSSANTLAANYKNTNTGAKKHVEALQTSFSEGKDKTLGLQVGAQLGNTMGATYQTAIKKADDYNQKAEMARRASLSVGATAESDSSTVARAVMENNGYMLPGSTPGHETYDEQAFVDKTKADYLKLGGNEAQWKLGMKARELRRQKTWNAAGSRGGAALEVLNDYSTQHDLDDGAQLISSAFGSEFKDGGAQFTEKEQAAIDKLKTKGGTAEAAAVINTQNSQQAAGKAAQVQAPATGVNPAGFTGIETKVDKATHTAPVVQGGMPQNTVPQASEKFKQAEDDLSKKLVVNTAAKAVSVGTGLVIGGVTAAETGSPATGAALGGAITDQGLKLTDKFLPKGSVNDTANPMFELRGTGGATPAQPGTSQSLSGAPGTGGSTQYAAPAAQGGSAPVVMGEYSADRKDSEGHKFTVGGVDESGRPVGGLVEKDGVARGYYVGEDGKWFLGEEKWKNGMPEDPAQFKGMYAVSDEGVMHHDGEQWRPVDKAPEVKQSSSDMRKTNYVATTYQAGPKYTPIEDPFKKD
ncbi:MAG: conjugal transfer protein TraG N-terminal domain-containing protein [Sideroxydans sp.]|nr:conjugal transfer protein TraG N-terminal domain-containing protein [Sideroxydans sp.]MDD5056615.1 conjugal transfer protein TraG N-terminal domain-containing protein [Sideroxydans sp.]